MNKRLFLFYYINKFLLEKSPSDITGHVSYKIQHKAANCQLPTAYCQRNLAAGSWLSFMEFHSFFQLKRIFVFLLKIQTNRILNNEIML